MNNITINFLKEIFPLGTKNRQVMIRAIDPSGKGQPLTRIIDVEHPELALEDFDINPDYNYYYCPVSVSGSKLKRERAWKVHAVVADLDIHGDDSINIDEAIDSLLEELQIAHDDAVDEVGEAFAIPLPNIVVRTGRGVQLVWKLVDYSAHAQSDIVKFKNNASYKSTTEQVLDKFKACLFHHLNKIITDDSDYCGLSNISKFELDMGASNRFMGLFRLPGTYNANIQDIEYEVPYEILDSTPLTYNNINEIQKAYRNLFNYKTLTFAPTSSYKSNNYGVFHNVLSCKASSDKTTILQYIKSVRKLRNLPLGAEKRNDYCWVFFAIAKQFYGNDKALDLTQKFNQGFKNPLTPRELRNTLSSVMKSIYSCAGSLERLLNMTLAEVNQLGPIPYYVKKINKKKAKSKTKMAEKAERNQEIIKLYVAGLSQAEIARQFGVDRSIICRVIGEASNIVKKLLSRKKIAEIIAAKIEKASNMQVPTLSEILKDNTVIFQNMTCNAVSYMPSPSDGGGASLMRPSGLTRLDGLTRPSGSPQNKLIS